MAPVVAHLGGIDEIGIFVVPAVLVILYLRRSERRAKERAGHEAPADVETHSTDH